MRVVALLAAHNERRFIVPCIEHYVRHGVDVYLIDNESDDDTVARASQFLGRGLLGIERFPRSATFTWQPLLERKQQLAATLDADWFLHADPDEVRLPPRPGQTLASALAEVDAQGFNAVNFMEFTFVPTRQAPDHDHQDFQQTMRWYYPFEPVHPHQLKAWKKQPDTVDLASTGGHRVGFPGLRIYPESFPMRHYLFLSVPHVVEKYVQRAFDPAEVDRGWHRARARLRTPDIALQDEQELRAYAGDAALDPSQPLGVHPLFARSLRQS
ncbi:MAG: glycosyltransferase family 2 protein [Vicinamibacterales bacterium]